MSMNVGGISTGEYTDTVRHRRASGNVVRALPIEVFIAACIIADFSIVAIITYCAHPFSDGSPGIAPADIILAVALGVICHLTFQQGQLYDIRTLRDGLRCFGRLFLRWSFLCTLILAAIAIAGIKNPPPYNQWLLFFLAGIGGFALQRVIIGKTLRYNIARGRFIHSVAVIGDHTASYMIAETLSRAGSGIHVSGVFLEQEILGELTAAPERGHSLRDLIAREDVDSVIIAAPAMMPGKMSELLRLLRMYPSNIYATPESLSLPTMSIAGLRQTGFPELTLVPLVNCPNNKAELLVKNAIDHIVALVIVIMVFPLLLVCALGIALSDRGPVLFRQKRIGYNGNEFSILKFRTMYVASERNTVLTTRDDPRVFPFGSFLRKTSLDELPQVLNVLRGDMSLVGPRPHMPEATAAGVPYFEAVGDYTARHRVKPGITGWAQVNGWRGPTETIDQIQSRVAHDLYYIENWSLILDFTILLRTVFVMFGKNVF